MSNSDIVRAWKDEQFRNQLNSDQQAEVPDNPAGEIELDEAELSKASGAKSLANLTAGCCQASVNFQTCNAVACVASIAEPVATIVCLSVQSC